MSEKNGTGRLIIFFLISIDGVISSQPVIEEVVGDALMIGLHWTSLFSMETGIIISIRYISSGL
jgi:hypothetical protein